MRKLVRQIVGDYKSLKLIGQDEGYVVFSGKDPDSKEGVSIKILPRLLEKDPQIARRFQGLSRTIRQLNHPNIVSVRKVGEEEGLPYLVTRALEKAQPLTTKLNQPWAVDTAADLTMQVGQALEHAYNKGIVHGSLTPENIVVEDGGRVMVTDFGLTELQNLLGVSLQETASPYLAPEVKGGQPADARADVYSLASILYSMLAKRNPQIVDGEVLPPSRFNPEVPAPMDAVVVRALSPNPKDRYPDARSFLMALGAITLAPKLSPGFPVSPEGSCPQCGAENQVGRYCRKCGSLLAQPTAKKAVEQELVALDEPIQVTKVEVRQFQVGKGLEIHDTEISHPLSIAADDLLGQFPEPLEMPQIDTQQLWHSLRSKPEFRMPEPLPMPDIDWAGIVPPMPEVPVIEDIPFASEAD